MSVPVFYFDCFCGISGDMTVAALLDLGASREKLDAMLKSLHLHELDYAVGRKNSYGFDACDFDVILHHREDEHHHESEHHEHEHHEHGHCHDHHHEHRNIFDVEKIIDAADMTDRARELAKKTFGIVARAESEVHGLPVEQVHFHEVGALDSIADILSFAVCADDLGIERAAFSELTEGCGTVTCQHGEMPVPVPAVAKIAQKYDIPLRLTSVRGERVTPTGIAFVAALKNAERPSSARIGRIGTGCGKRDFGGPNVLRVMELFPNEEADGEKTWVLETNIDDSTGEQLGAAMEALFKNGAKDVHYMPCFMKKNRPAWLLRVIAEEKDIPVLEETVFRTTTTIGIRKFPVDRTRMERTAETLSLPFGDVKIKRCRFNGLDRRYPEYESVKALSEKTGIPFSEIYKQASK